MVPLVPFARINFDICFRRAQLAFNLLVLAITLLVLTTWPASSTADELILREEQLTAQSMGDFKCSSGPAENVGFIIENLIDSSGKVRTGELWDYFNSRGVESLDRLTLVINVDPEMITRQDFMLDSLTLTIAGSGAEAELTNITDVSMGREGDNLLGLRSGDFKKFAPEARMEFELGYDFMKRFESNSNETLSLNFHTRSGAVETAKLGFSGQTNSDSGSHLQAMLLFVTFWTVIFLLMYLFLSPKVPEKNSKTTPTSSGRTSRPKSRRLNSSVVDQAPNQAAHNGNLI